MSDVLRVMARMLWILTLALALGTVALPVRASDDDLPALERRFLGGLRTDGKEDYGAQREVLERIADLRTPAARALLQGLLERHGRADRRRAALILAALVRRGTPADAADAIRWVERSHRDPLMMELLHRVLAGAREPATRAWLRGDGLQKATARVKVQIVRALGEGGGSEAALPLLRLLRGENLLVRLETLDALGRLRAAVARPVVEAFLRDEDAHLREAAARALGLLGDARAVPALRGVLEDAVALVAESAAIALGRMGAVSAVPDLIAGLARWREDDLRLADAFLRALQAISGKAIPDDPEQWRRWWQAAKAKPIRRGGDPGAVAPPPGGVRYYDMPVRSSRLVFVLDVSRSMGWNERLDAAKEEILKVLEQLPARTRFDLVFYSDTAWAWRSALTTATRKHVGDAAKAIRKLAPVNGTNTHAALALAFGDEEADTIFFLSDGHPSVGAVTDPDLILLEVRQWNRLRRVKVHVVALLRGKPPPAFAGRENRDRAESFMRRLAAQNEGVFKLVE